MHPHEMAGPRATALWCAMLSRLVPGGAGETGAGSGWGDPLLNLEAQRLFPALESLVNSVSFPKTTLQLKR